MGDIILLLYLRDADYGKRLLRFLAGKKNPRLHPELVTARNGLEYREEKEQEELVVLTDCAEVKETEKRKVLYLANRQERERKQIFQYQKAENIYREILWQLNIQHREKESGPESPDRGIYGVLAPGGCGATVFSVMLAQYLGIRGNCLYLGMNGFPVYFGERAGEEPDLGSQGISELLFSLEKADFSEQEKRLKRPFGKAWMLPPLSHYKDLLDCGPRDWETFLKRLLEEGGYDSIVVEMGQLYEFSLDLFELSDRTFLLVDESLFGGIRSAVFNRYCALEGKQQLQKKTEVIRLSWEIGGWEKELAASGPEELAEDSQKMAYIREIVDRGEEEDVCVWREGE